MSRPTTFLRTAATATCLAALATSAQAGEPRHYVGEAVCTLTSDFVHLEINEADRAYVVTRSRDVDDPYDSREGTLKTTGQAFSIIADGGYPIKLQGTFEAEGATVRATMLDTHGDPAADCAPLVMRRLQLPAAHMAELSALFAIPDPTLEQAQRAGELSLSRPALTHVPEIERPAALEKFRMERKAFWPRFWTAESNRQEGMPAATPDDLKALADRVEQCTADGMALGDTAILVGSLYGRDPSLNSGLFAMLAQERLADRQHALGIVPKPRALGGDTEKCRRLTRAGHIVGIDEAAVVFGLPADYWDAAALDTMRSEIKACEAATPEGLRSFLATALKTLQSEEPSAAKRVAARQWLEAERDRLLALPKTAATLKTTDTYQLDDAAQREHEADDAAVSRFFEPRVAPVRLTALAAAKSEIDSLFAKAQPGTADETAAAALCNDLGTLQDIATHCRTVTETYAGRVADGLVTALLEKIKATKPGAARLALAPGLRLPEPPQSAFRDAMWSKLSAASPAFEAAAGPPMAEALDAAKAEVTQAFAAARPRDASEKAAYALCEGVVDPDLAGACATARSDYDTRRGALLCEAVMATAKVPPELAAARFGFAGANKQLRFVSGRDVVCQVATLGLAAGMEDNSGFFSAGLKMTLKPDATAGTTASELGLPIGAMLPAGQSVQVLFSADKDATGAYWTLDTIADAKGNALPSILMPKEMFGCMFAGVC
jgi:hypothetical protein